jgi:uncharacterized repeat protein (TIGR01451 family)
VAKLNRARRGIGAKWRTKAFTSSTTTHRRSRRGAAVGGLLVLLTLVGALLVIAPVAIGANPSATLEQCANDKAPSPRTDGCDSTANQWVSGNVNEAKAVYVEGDSIPYRMTFDNLATGATVHHVTIEWDTTKSSKHAIDYLTTYNRTVATANPCLGVSGCTFPDTPDTFVIPADPQVTGAGVTPVAGNLTLFGGDIVSVSRPLTVGNTLCTNANSAGFYCYSTGTGYTGDKSAAITVDFTTTVANPVLAWGGHIASRGPAGAGWGAGNSAVSISGSPYHMRLIALDGAGGNQDRSLSAGAVIFPGAIHVVKNTTGGDATFGYTAGPSPLANCSITTSGGTGGGPGAANCFFDTITNFQTYTINESTIPANWAFDSVTCAIVPGTANGGSSSTSTTTATINLAEGEGWICTYANHFNASRTLSIDKSTTTASYDHVGQVIPYSILVTNTGNVSQNITVSDTPALDNFTCTPTNGSAVAAGGTMTCTGSHTVTLADLDAGSFSDQACANATGATEVCDSVTVPGTQNPHLAITKEATESGFSAVGDVIHYTITATNDGNVTLHNVDVTDAQVSNLSCTPTTPVADLAPGESITCTASHTITLADLNTGSFFNQACVDDGAGGAASVCDDVTTPGTQSPALTIEKTSTTTLITAAGQVVPYHYVVTNTGNVTLTGVTLADDKVAAVDITCTPTQPATLAPTATMTCDGSHTVTQAEFDGGGNLVNIATADSDQTGPSQDTVTIPIQPPPAKGHIFHTGVTCANFLSNNPSDELANGDYSVKSGKVNQVNPGVMFYYISIEAPSSSFTINVTQSNDAGWKPIPVQATNQVILYNADCSKSNTGTSSVNTTNGTATITVSGATAGATYVVGVKYSLSGLSGQSVSSPFPTVTYSFATNFNGGSNLPSSGDTIVLSPKP